MPNSVDYIDLIEYSCLSIHTQIIQFNFVKKTNIILKKKIPSQLILAVSIKQFNYLNITLSN